jgi:hypothetical protein
MLEHVTYCGFTLQIIRTQAWTRSEFCDIYDFGGELLTGLTMDASSYYAKWSPSDLFAEIVDVVEENFLVGHLSSSGSAQIMPPSRRQSAWGGDACD